MTVHEIYAGSNGDATKDLYARLEQLSPAGTIALNLFRAQKCSSRAKEYSRRYKGDAYERKNWSMGLLCDALLQHGDALKIRWGWKEDPDVEYHKWVLYIELPTGQVSFHALHRGKGPDYTGEWDQSHASAGRIVNWCAQLLEEPPPPPQLEILPAPPHPPSKPKAPVKFNHAEQFKLL